MDRETLIEVQQEAAAAMAAGVALAKDAERRLTAGDDSREGAALGQFIADPGRFWAQAAAGQYQPRTGAAEAAAAAVKLAAAKLAAGDLSFPREALLGQSVWLASLSGRLAHQADKELAKAGPGSLEKALGCWRLAMKAQGQAAAAVSTAAALNKLSAADAVEVTG